MENPKDKILIIDDSLLNIKILTDILSPYYTVFSSTSPFEGLTLAVSQSPDLILLDIVMPKMDGYDVCRKIKEDPLTADIPVIFVTSLDDETEETKGLETGAIDYITKPFSAPIVKIRVKNQLELKRHRDLLVRLSTLDGLTGIPNRRQFDLVLGLEWRHAIRDKTPISLIMMDIDYFKAFNDLFGHLSGDDCLKNVAQTLFRSIKRSTDLLARFGGEEFACILPNTDLNGSLIVANHLRERIENLKIPHSGSEIGSYLTISVGVSSIIPTPSSCPECLIAQVDELLYSAKYKGRNQVAHVIG